MADTVEAKRAELSAQELRWRSELEDRCVDPFCPAFFLTWLS
jgi:hypothetical protein